MATQQEQPTLPTPPFYTIPNINNLRDAALFPLTTSSGQKLRPGILFRSAEVSKLEASGWKSVRDLGIAHVFDLRSKPEVDKGWAGIVGSSPSGVSDVQPLWISDMVKAGVERSWTPVFEESDYSPERLAERYGKYMDKSVSGFVHAYTDILRNAGPAFRTILLYLANLDTAAAAEQTPSASASTTERAAGTELRKKEPQGALIHCTAGKDRTGMFFAVLFSFLCVPREQIAQEYNLTEQGLWHIREDVVSRLLQTPGFVKYISAQVPGMTITPDDVAVALQTQNNKNSKSDKTSTQNDSETKIPPEILQKGRDAALRMIGARKESMLGALDMLESEFGGAERYLREKCGLGDGELEGLRRSLVVGWGEGEKAR